MPNSPFLRFLIAACIHGPLYYYLWRRLLRDTELARRWRLPITLIFVALCGSVPLAIVSRHLPATIGSNVQWIAFFWMALAGLMTVGVLGVDAIALLLSTLRRFTDPNSSEEPSETNPDALSRRLFLRRVTGSGIAMSATSLSALGAKQATRTPDIVNRPITLRRLPKSMDGFSIVQITDLHVGNTIGEEFVTRIVDAVNNSAPDLIVITGDLVDGSVADLREHVAPLARLRAPHGVFFVTGNHEYYAGADAWILHLRTLGIRVLRNERTQIGDEDDFFDLAGIDDHGAGRWAGHGPDLVAATADRDENRELILLAHQPRQVHEAKKYGVGLQLSGHTHGGQIWPWHYLAKAQQGGLLAGHSRHGDTQLYISRGTGYWGPPVRVFAKSEITRVILKIPK